MPLVLNSNAADAPFRQAQGPELVEGQERVLPFFINLLVEGHAPA